MGERIELPQVPSGDSEQQLRQMYSYLYRVAQALNHNLSEIGSMDLTDDERQVMQSITEQQDSDAVGYDWNGKESLKSLIIKTAAFVQSKLDAYRINLLGEYVAEGKFGRYVRNTGLNVDITPEGIQQNFTFEEVVQGLKTYEINAKNYIKTGLLRTVNGVPVYGVAIGKDVVTFSENGTETYNDGNKVAELTADELSFWQSGNKVASYTGSKISFLIGGSEVFYIQSGKIYSAKDLELASGKKLIIDTSNFKIDSSGNVTINGGGTFSGALSAATGTFAGSLSAATGTFAGTMSAACITSGTMSADRISGGTIDASQTTVKNLDASKITTGTMSANKISGGSIDASNVTITNLNASNITSGTMSANKISGGTIDASNVTINNLNASKITSGTLDASVVTVKNIDASKITTGTMSANKISGGTIDASNVTITNLNASNITSGTMSASKISGGTIDASNVTINNLNASKITSGTMSANKISGGSIDASNVTITNLNASNITSGTMSASKISGGTLTLGGNNNGNGEMVIKNGSGTTIGNWNKDGFSTNGGKFEVKSNNLNIDNTGGYFSTKTDNLLFAIGNISNDNTTDFFSRITPAETISQDGNTYHLDMSVEEKLTNSGYKTMTHLYFGTFIMYDYSTDSYIVPTGIHATGLKKNNNSNSTSTVLTAIELDRAKFKKIHSLEGKIQTLYYDTMYQSSSRDIKHDIKPMEELGDKIDNLRPVTFVYDDDPDEKVRNGLIYEDTIDIMPEICTQDESRKAINYVELVPVLLKEIQELRARVKALEEREGGN